MKGMAGRRETSLPGLPVQIYMPLWGRGDSQPCWRADPCKGHGNAAPQCGPQGMGQMREDRPGWQVLSAVEILGKQKALTKLGRSEVEIVRKTARTVILMWWLIFFLNSSNKGMSRSYCTSYLSAFKQWDSSLLLNFTQQEELLLCSETSVSVEIFL